MASPNVYSFRDIVGGLAFPYVGAQTLNGGYIGLKTITFSYATERSSQELGSDGTVLVSAIAGNNGHIEIEVLQVSIINSYLLSWFNSCYQAQLAGDVSQWAAGTAAVRSITDGANYIATGISPMKPPDTVYSAQGTNKRWTLMVADLQSSSSIATVS